MFGPFDSYSAIEIGVAAVVVGFRRDRRAALKKNGPATYGRGQVKLHATTGQEGRRDRAYPLPTQDVTAARSNDPR